MIFSFSFSVFLGIFGVFFLKQYLHNQEVERKRQAEIEAENEYEDKFRTGMTRVYQNLKLEHYLAAYKNIEFIPQPRRTDPQRVDEYLEALTRIGRGLIESQLLKEAENIFMIVRSFEGQMPTANEALSRIESKRGIDNAKLFISQGEHLINQKKYRDANVEFHKAQLELRTVEALKFDDVKELKGRLMPQLLEAKFFTYIADAEDTLRTADAQLKARKFRKTDEALTQAAIQGGRAAYLRPEAPEVIRVRERIAEIDAELGYLLPNEVPIWNLYSKEEMSKNSHFFGLVGYELSPKVDDNGSLKIALQYLMHAEEPFFIVRYRIYFYNNKDIFNGHFLMAEPSFSADQVRSVVYLQEIPEESRRAQVKRIEVKVFDPDDKIVSRVSRAFRKTSS